MIINITYFFYFSTPLHIAAGEGHNDACDFLRTIMRTNSDRNIDPIGAQAPVDLNGTTPVGWAAVRTRYVTSYKHLKAINEHIHIHLFCLMPIMFHLK